MGLVAYLSWALPRTDEPEYETTAVIMDDDVDGRAQRMNPTAPNPAPNPTNVIVNPPPVVTTPPPVITTPPPVVVRPPERTTIVEGAGVDPAPARRNPPQNQNQNQNQDQTDRTDNTDGGSTSDGGDVDGTVPDRQ